MTLTEYLKVVLNLYLEEFKYVVHEFTLDKLEKLHQLNK